MTRAATATTDDGGAGRRPLPDRWLMLIPLLVTAGVGVLAVALTLYLAALPAAASGTVVAVFAPGRDAADNYLAIRAAGGRLLTGTGFDAVWVVNGAAPGFAGRLHDAGALTVLDPAVLAPFAVTGCYLAAPPRDG